MTPRPATPAQRTSTSCVAARARVCAAALLLAGCVSACADPDATLLLTASSSGVALSGFPFTPPDPDETDDAAPEPVELADGWEIEFSRVIVVAGGVVVGSDADPKIEVANQYAFDLAADDPIEIKRQGGGEGDAQPLSFRTLPVVGETLPVNVGEGDIAAMQEAGASIFIVGEATKGPQARRFELLLPAAAVYEDCKNGFTDTDGLKLIAGALTKAEFTFDAGSFLRSSLAEDNTQMRFEALAAAAGPDGVLTFDELASQPLSALLGVDGMPLVDDQGNAVTYDLAGETGTTLQDFVLHAVRRGLTINGGGACQITPTDP